MSNPVIKVENLSKQYRLGEVGTGTISHDLNRWWYRIRGKEDPYLRIGESNDRSTKGNSEYVWALQDINFEVQQGEVLGIIGKNGAGKSTLLKILSKVTAPTTGSIKAKGRIAALLEVGTGFHPELTGRENIFLNGAILGMTKREVTAKLDEIVDFSGVERYLDTPVKRYSSGMMVRLGFAVAAHLDPEILIVDEVLAVGDAEFQKKCLGKMQDVSKNDGRTILFVSHNMESIELLCSKTIWIERGGIEKTGMSGLIISAYLSNYSQQLTQERRWPNIVEAPGTDVVKLTACKIIDQNNTSKRLFRSNEKIGIVFEYEVFKEGKVIWSGFNLHKNDVNVFDSHSVTIQEYTLPHSKGKYRTVGWIYPNLLNEGDFIIGVALFNHNEGIIHCHVQDALAFSVIDGIEVNTPKGKSGGVFPGLIRPSLEWKIESH